MSVEGDVMRIQKKLSKMSSSDGEVSEKLLTWACFCIVIFSIELKQSFAECRGTWVFLGFFLNKKLVFCAVELNEKWFALG